LEKYGKGFLLVPNKQNKDWGTKYYHNGWWMPKHNAWFFKKEYEDFLLENGASNKLKKISCLKKEMKTKSSKKKYNETFNFKTHGRGFLLVPEEGHPDWGTKYYHNGWWMPKYNAWFFRKNDKESFLKSNSKMDTKKSHTKSSKDKENEKINFKSHGRGFLLVPGEGHPDWGTKYYHNGWWMPKYNAWFFKKNDKESFLKSHSKMDTKKSHTKSSKNKEDKTFNFKTYGKGFLLVPEEGHPDWGTKYYHNGWWMPKYNAWFFKKNDKESFLKSHSKTKTEKNDKQSEIKMLKDLVVKEYGKGFLLVPKEGHPDWGTKYYHNGWWVPKHNAWFFKKNAYLDFVLDNEEENENYLFEGFKLKKYGKGYLLTVNKNHQDWGEKYYYNGWWFDNKGGWFFKKEWKSFLIDNGAKMSKKSCEDDEVKFQGFKMESYGKGLLLKPPVEHCQWGEKYYFGGWWFPKQNGWFFKKEFKNFLKENGANK
jgi:hypothetical protein